jgi:hypothetical protein
MGLHCNHFAAMSARSGNSHRRYNLVTPGRVNLPSKAGSTAPLIGSIDDVAPMCVNLCHMLSDRD